METEPPNFGLPTLYHVLPDAVERNIIRDFAQDHRDALVSFLVNKPNHPGKLELIGSGFFIYTHDLTAAKLITAANVIREFKGRGWGWITVGERLFKVEGVDTDGTISYASTLDLAIWEIPSNFFFDQDPDFIELKALLNNSHDLARDGFKPLSSFMIFGYPASKNSNLDFRQGKKPDRALFAMALHQSSYDKQTNELCFPFNGTGTPEAWVPKNRGVPHPRGMSGSPCVRFVVHHETGRIGFEVAGVFTRWTNNNKEIRAVALPSAWLQLSLPAETENA